MTLRIKDRIESGITSRGDTMKCDDAIYAAACAEWQDECHAGENLSLPAGATALQIELDMREYAFEKMQAFKQAQRQSVRRGGRR